MSSSETPSHYATSILQDVQAAMSEYFTLLCRMPHMKGYNCVAPPEQGWPGLDEETLRTFGKSDEAIGFLRRLPCLVGESPVPASMTPFSNAICFYDGKTWEPWRNEICITPSHVVLIGLPPFRELRYLLLDTEVGSITEYAPMGGTELLKYEEYESLPDADKWMANSTLPARAFFARECQRLERLVYMPVPRTNDAPKYYFRVNNAAEEADLLAVEDEEWGSDHDMDPDYVESDQDVELVSSEDEDGDDMINPQQKLRNLELNSKDSSNDWSGDEDDDMSISSEELQALISDLQHNPPEPVFSASLGRWKPPVLGKNVPRVYEIYKQNGWPSASFNVDKCRTELLTFMEEVERERKEKVASANKNNDPDFRRRMIEQRQRIEEQRRKEGSRNR